MDEKLELHFGPLAPSLEHQLRKHGLTCAKIGVYEGHRQAINRLFFAECLTEDETKKAKMRLVRKIAGSAFRQEEASR